MTNRREFLLGAGAIAAGTTMAGGKDAEAERFVPHGKALKITGTFLDEITWDIPHQNWGYREWEQDFLHMKAIGIDTVILIRCGLDRFIAYPSEYLIAKKGCYRPPIDLVEMFLTLADKHGMKFFFGTYHGFRGKQAESPAERADINQFVIDEVWTRYGHHPSFKGWYLSQEVSARTRGSVELYRKTGGHCKEVSNGLPVLVSPIISGCKAVDQFSSAITQEQRDSLTAHEKAWDEIFSGIKGAVDICAFQDGHIDYHELDDFLTLNKRLASKHGIQCWTNTETFDRDMPIKFLPIHLEKLLLKLEAAARAGYEKSITFEFSHFMSPQSMYASAGHLFNRYRECFNV